MTEGKSILMIAFDIIFAIAFLGIWLFAGRQNQRMWSIYERGEVNKSDIAAYAEMAAYDNTTVGGQDLVSLMTTSKGDPFVLILDQSGTKLACSYDAYTFNYQLDESCFHVDYGAVPSYIRTIATSGQLGNQLQTVPFEHRYDYQNTTIHASDLTYNFLTGDLCASEGKYAKYDTTLVYDGNSSTVIGVVAVKQP